MLPAVEYFAPKLPHHPDHRGRQHMPLPYQSPPLPAAGLTLPPPPRPSVLTPDPMGPTTSQTSAVGAFLTQHGLQYLIPSFLEEGFTTLTTLFDVTEADFEYMKIKRGDRRRLQRAMAEAPYCCRRRHADHSLRHRQHSEQPQARPRSMDTRAQPSEREERGEDQFVKRCCRLPPISTLGVWGMDAKMQLPPSPPSAAGRVNLVAGVMGPTQRPGERHVRYNSPSLSPVAVPRDSRGYQLPHSLSSPAPESGVWGAVASPSSPGPRSSGTAQREAAESPAACVPAPAPIHSRPSIVPRPRRRYRRHPKPDLHRPPKPQSAYVKYSTYMRSLHPDLDFSTLAKLAGSRWKHMDPETKRRLEEEAEGEKKVYRRKLEDYRGTEEWKRYEEYLKSFAETERAAGRPFARPK